jgi:Uncharacterized protein conserved in bacteria
LGLIASSFPIEEPALENFSSWPADLPDLNVLYVYGLSLEAYKFLQPWLHTDSSRRLIFLENRQGLIGAFLQTIGAADPLADPQVEFHFLPKGSALNAALQSLAEAHPVGSLDVVALPSRRTSYFRSLRLQLLRKTLLSEAILKDRSYGYQLFFNFVQNAPHVERSFYFNALKGAFSSIPAVICGAGPSLSSAFKTLEALENRALIFACGSAIAACSAAGITPHFCVAVDPNQEEFLRLKNSFAFEVPFIYSTRVHPHVFSTLNGPLGYVRSQFGDISQLWLEEELGLTGPLVGHQLSSESISVTSMAVAAAEWLGCPSILFAGLDMAYTGEQRYCSAVGVSQTPQEKSSQTTSDRILSKKDRKGKKVHSAVRWVMESSSLSHYAKLHPHVQFINTTDGGIGFQSIPYQPLDLAIRQFPQEYDLRGLLHAAISSASLPSVSISQKLDELRFSLLKVIDHLHILSGLKSGSTVLAEIEMKEEIAFSVLFYDVFRILPHIVRTNKSSTHWPAFLELAQKYLAVM